MTDERNGGAVEQRDGAQGAGAQRDGAQGDGAQGTQGAVAASSPAAATDPRIALAQTQMAAPAYAVQVAEDYRRSATSLADSSPPPSRASAAVPPSPASVAPGAAVPAAGVSGAATVPGQTLAAAEPATDRMGAFYWLGLSLVLFAILAFLAWTFTAIEQNAGGPVRVNLIAWLLYQNLGKYPSLALFGVFALLSAGAGIRGLVRR